MSRHFSVFNYIRNFAFKTGVDPRVLIWPLKGSFFVLPAWVFVNDSFIEHCQVTGNSMSPTLSPQFHETGRCDQVAVWKYGATRNISRGEIVALWAPHNPEKVTIKRVIATEADTVYPKAGPFEKQMVPKGHIWVEGDNWRSSKDSNEYGPVSKALVIGKAVGVLWPLNRAGWLSTEWRHPRTRVVRGNPRLLKDEYD
ncbi:MAG: hypothetical protein M1820_005153 [Bogoriella megaspora]|nr:MAG: hypothetical protein M1820_005153 [Bogoriella megaspora]